MPCVFIMHSIITDIYDCFFSADDGGVSGAQADSKRVRGFPSSKKPRHKKWGISSSPSITTSLHEAELVHVLPKDKWRGEGADPFQT
jgi:hypothetical protein